MHFQFLEVTISILKKIIYFNIVQYPLLYMQIGTRSKLKVSLFAGMYSTPSMGVWMSPFEVAYSGCVIIFFWGGGHAFSMFSKFDYQ